MRDLARLRQTLSSRLRSTTLFTRIAVGNAVVIIFGAIAGTLLTRHLTDVAADIWLIFIFATIGLSISVAVNFWIIHAALTPLKDLRQIVDGIQAGTKGVDDLKLTNPDPDLELLASALGSLITQLEASNRWLRTLSKRTINAQEEERKRIARSLHDDTGQALSMLIINLERLEHLLSHNAELKDQVSNAHKLAAGILDELRKIISGLRPSILDDLGLISAIRWYARTNLEQAGINIVIDAPDEEFNLPGVLKTTLFRITQEAVSNIIRHSQAQNAMISLTKNEKQVYLFIEDDGKGFDIQKVLDGATKEHHWGLVGIQERVDLVGGEFRVKAAHRSGTRMEVTAPIIPRSELVDG
jgi:two-component system sensor histidine kinase UhpB